MWYEIVMAILSSGVVTGVLTWKYSQKKRNNDFIAELQGSINILTTEYTKTLNELTSIRKNYAEVITKLDSSMGENAALVAKLQEALSENVKLHESLARLEKEMIKLKEENATLIKKVNELNKLLKIKAE